MVNRKFALQQKVKVIHDGYNNFPKDSVGTIVFLGCKYMGQWRYHVQFNNGVKITVHENELGETNG